jgi:hypothetical protein
MVWRICAAPSPSEDISRRLAALEKWIRLRDQEQQLRMSPLGRRPG